MDGSTSSAVDSVPPAYPTRPHADLPHAPNAYPARGSTGPAGARPGQEQHQSRQPHERGRLMPECSEPASSLPQRCTARNPSWESLPPAMLHAISCVRRSAARPRLTPRHRPGTHTTQRPQVVPGRRQDAMSPRGQFHDAGNAVGAPWVTQAGAPRRAIGASPED